ncbi:MAG: cytochrome b, partial [Pseudomonadota bacterium]
MSATNTAQHFGWVTKSFHWLTALLILAAIVLGVVANGAAYETSDQIAQKSWLFSFHKTIGLAAFFAALFRVLWAFTQKRPGKIGTTAWENWLADVAHWALYASMIFVPLAGWVTHAASSGYAPIWWPFGQDLPLVPKSPALSVAAGQVHMAWEKILLVSIILHVAGAVKHHVIDKDATLRRMLPGQPKVTVHPKQATLIPPIVAAVIFGGVAFVAAAQADLDAPGSQVTLAQPVASDWVIQDGTVAITVTQFGSAVPGAFADWTA